MAEEWSSCFKSKCAATHTAIQRRNVYCTVEGIKAEDSKCNRKTRPTMKRECYSEKCKGVWRVEKWSECQGLCDSYGTRRRSIQCVWYGTKKAAGDICRNLPPPTVITSCKVPACPEASAATGDNPVPTDLLLASTEATSGALNNNLAEIVLVFSLLISKFYF